MIQIAQVLQNTVHRPADLVARYGGEEFVIILSETHVDAQLVSEKKNSLMHFFVR